MYLKKLDEITCIDLSPVLEQENVSVNCFVDQIRHYNHQVTRIVANALYGEIKNILQNCIDEEDKRHPLTDETLMNILNEKGYCIARRTVAKYREMLDIPVARLRKQI